MGNRDRPVVGGHLVSTNQVAGDKEGEEIRCHVQTDIFGLK